MLPTVLLIAQLDILSDLGGWFEEVWDQIRSVDIKYLILGCTLQTIQTSLNGLAWRNILAECDLEQEDEPDAAGADVAG